MRLDTPQDFIPWDAARPARREVTVQFVGPGVDLTELWLGQRKHVRTPPDSLPQAVKKLHLLLRRQGVQVDLRVRHGPFSRSPTGASNVGLTPRLSCERRSE